MDMRLTQPTLLSHSFRNITFKNYGYHENLLEYQVAKSYLEGWKGGRLEGRQIALERKNKKLGVGAGGAG